MKVKILKRWGAAPGALPGDIVDLEDRHVKHGLDTGLCEKIVVPVEKTVRVANVPNATKKQGGRRKGRGKKSA